MISKKDLAPLDNPDFSVWLATLKHRKNKTLWALHGFCQDFFTWCCSKNYLGCSCVDCLNYDICLRYKLTIKEVKQELCLREFKR